MTNFVTVEGRTLAAALKNINRVVQKSHIPILNTVRLIANSNGLLLKGTSLDVELTTDIDAMDGHGEIDVCLPSRLFERIARTAGPAPVKITTTKADKVQVDIANGDAVYDLVGYPAADFPDMKTGIWEEIETFTNGRLASILDRVAPCISNEETRYYLNGACWQVDQFGRHMTATDGHRLANVTYPSEPEERLFSAIIPYQAVKVLSAIGQGQDVAVSGSWDQGSPAGYAGGAREATPPRVRHLSFWIGRTRLVTRTIDGTFPDWRRVLPKETPYAIEFDAEVLRTALERVAPISTDLGRAVRIYRGDDGNAHLSVKTADTGDAVARAFAAWPAVPAGAEHDTKLTGGGWTPRATYSSIGFNASYLKAAIGKLPGKFILRFSDSGAPAMIDSGDPELTRVIMPMRF